jgi:hypothetical protein
MFQALMKIAEDSVRQFQELQHTQSRLLEAVAPGNDKPAGKNNLALVPMQRLSSYHALLTKMASRQMFIYQGAWSLALKPDLVPSLLSEGLELQHAIVQRLAAQHAQIVQGVDELAEDVGGLKKANTMSKLMEQEYNLFAQLGSMLVGQATALMELLENIQISYGYLLTRKTQDEAS